MRWLDILEGVGLIFLICRYAHSDLRNPQNTHKFQCIRLDIVVEGNISLHVAMEKYVPITCIDDDSIVQIIQYIHHSEEYNVNIFTLYSRHPLYTADSKFFGAQTMQGHHTLYGYVTTMPSMCTYFLFQSLPSLCLFYSKYTTLIVKLRLVNILHITCTAEEASQGSWLPRLLEAVDEP